MGEMLTQAGAGSVVSPATPSDAPFQVVSTATTSTAPAGMPCASTVTVPSPERGVLTVTRPLAWPLTGGFGSADMLGQPALTGTRTTCLSPSVRSLALAPTMPDSRKTARVTEPPGFAVTA
jgi:hypothetical protein